MIAPEPIYDQWVFGKSSAGGVRRHAVKRTRVEGFGEDAMTIQALCGVSGGLHALSASNTRFDPAADERTCQACARRWAAHQAAAVPGWTKWCRSCEREKPIGLFHVDKRTTDRLSTRCLDCEEAARAVVKAAEGAARSEALRQQALTRAHEAHQRRLDALVRWQAEDTLPSYFCSVGHVLTAVAGTRVSDWGQWPGCAWPTERWECPCGRINATDAQVARAWDALHALEVLAGVRRDADTRITVGGTAE